MVRWVYWLLLGVVLVGAEWLPTVTVVEEEHEIEYLKSVAFTDNSTKISYLLWIKPSDFSANLRIVEPDGKCRSPIKINTNQRVQYEMQVSITGAHDGKHIYIGFLGSRTSEPVTDCNDEERGGCTDVFIVETEDGGLTWTQPVAVPRPDMNDPFNRDELQLLVNWANLRVWLLYKLISPDDPSNSKLMLATRSPKSRVFTNEMSLGFEPGGFLKFFLNIEGSTPILSLFWRSSNGNGYLVTSRNSGITWTKPQAFSVCEGTDKPIFVHSGNYMLPEYEFTLCQGSSFYVKMSADVGKTWSRSVDLPADPLSFEACVNSARTRETGALMWLYKGDSPENTIVGSTRLANAQLVEKKMRPFESLMQYATCTYTGNNQINVWTLSIKGETLVISLDINNNVFE